MGFGKHRRCPLGLGLIVEGQSDRDTIPILARRLGYDARIRPRVVSRGDMLAQRAISRYLTKFLRDFRDVTLVIICLDAERENPAQVFARTRQVERRLNESLPVPVRYAIVDHALEGWLACDENALRSVLGPRARINIRGNPENHPSPADILNRIFRDNRRKFRKTQDDPKIAQAITPQNIAVKSPTFQRFAQLLGHPVTP